MMGHKDKLKTGLEYDVIFGRKYYCYLHNNSKLKSYAKNQINRRSRYNSKKNIKKEIADFEELLELNFDKINDCEICESFDCSACI